MQPHASAPARNGLASAVSCCLRVGRRGALSVVLLGATAPAWAACDNAAPTAGQTVTCTPAAPNPQTTPIASVAGSAGVTVNVQTNAELVVPTGAAIALDGGGGHRIDNRGTITGTAGAAILSNTATTVINRGVISGGTTGIIFGLGADRLEMLGGSITGGVLQGAGTDSVVISDGTLDHIDQGEGEDSLEISAGTVTGTIDQSRDPDTFVMTGGTIGALLQGDGFDRFRMTAGHIIGGFDDGDSAEMTGGRIGRVNMKLDDNIFLMSGGSIDANLVTGLGKDRVELSGGDIGGNISVSGGDDIVKVSGGSVGGSILLSVGNDRFEWTGGGVLRGPVDFGEGNDTATLTNLTPTQMSALPLFDAGPGTDKLDMLNVKTGGVARFANWEQVNATRGTELTMDGTLALGDSASGTGALVIDSASALLAGGGGGRVAAFTAGQLANVSNAGRIDLGNGSSAPGDTFTIAGNYVGNGGTLALQTVLGSDASASDRLVIAGGSATGNTVMRVTNVGGGGASTVADGIMVVQATNGGSTAAGAFALAGSLSAGAYEYFLFKGGVSAGTSNNWYLRSTIVPGPVPAPVVVVPDPPPPPPPVAGVPPEPPPPPVPVPVPSPMLVPPTPQARPPQMAVVPIYRVETPAYAVMPPLLREASMASLGTFHERQGEQRLLRGEGIFRSVWGRLIGQSHEQSWAGDAQPGFDGDFLGVQAGGDLYANAGDLRHQVGLFVGQTRAKGNVTGFALGWENVAVGRTRLDDKHLGLYYTLVGSENGYLDAVLMRSRYDGDSVSSRGIGVDIEGDGTTASLEVGKPLLQFGGSAWWLEPQAQVIWQKTRVDDTRDALSVLRVDNDDAWTARIGLRLAGDYMLRDNGWQPYVKVNYWRAFSGEDRIDIGGDPLVSEQGYRALEVGVGVVARYNANISAFAVADYTRDLDSHRLKERRVIEGNIGLRVDF
ncbi:autotransporter outer membrane beta-barrel domain-containing protein [uncultured Stenotrophomonas sp.]|uniref:autotransporter family protein n=1 Tax=uncultured Stenotrophomonas sp. TaxID=165438 RepID=UPI0028E95A7B|nr:autotransporter outer membrane beta-barrel domain-containing protein [uncultured Stenotrophomonas sp.]